MASRRIVALILFCSATATAADLDRVREMKKEMLSSRRVAAPQAQTTTKTVNVDCTKGEKIQDAVDKNAAPLDILVHGICVESVTIRAKDFTLRGTDPMTDGIQGVAGGAALRATHLESALIENLGFVNSAGSSFIAEHADAVNMNNCRVVGNQRGIQIGADSNFIGNGLTVTSNAGRAFWANGARFVGCNACNFSGNGGFTGTSLRGSIVTFLDSEVIATNGIQAITDAYIDVDCLSVISTHTCSLQASNFAAIASQQAQAALFGSGDFTGKLFADDHADLYVLGARQITGTGNSFDSFATLWVEPLEDENNVVQQSRINGALLTGFVRALVRDQSTLNGAIQCQSASDAWLDATVIRTPGSSVTGCEHAN